MPDTITITVPADAPERDLRRVRQEAKVAARNAAIARAYDKLLDDYPYREAMRRLAEQHDTSVRTIRRVVWGG